MSAQTIVFRNASVIIRQLLRDVLKIFPWVLLWASINTGIDQLRPPTTALNVVHNIRAFFPLLAGAFAGIMLIAGLRKTWSDFWKSPVALLTGYSLVALAGSLFFSPDRVLAGYWGVAYLSVFAVLAVLCTKKDVMQNIQRMLGFNRFFAVFVLVIAAVFVIAFGIKFGMFSIFAKTIGFFGPNGVGRFAAVATLIGLVRMPLTEGAKRPFWFLVICLGAALLAYSHARAAIVALLVACLVLFWLRKYHWVLRYAPLFVLLAGVLSIFVSTPLTDFVFKSPRPDQVVTFSGRTVIWKNLLVHVPESPIVGFGYHADRFFVRDQAQNAIIHALIQGGIVGGLLFALGILYGLWLSVKVLCKKNAPAFAIEAAALVVFFAIRGLAESSGAFFGTDLLFLSSALVGVFAFLRIAGQQNSVHQAA